ncbi:MAG: methyltransferase domain-containing protein [Candidatus Thorarchaeota archaeon]|nr:methyltransferase domain-containing protein [Candidatus Thorarchaeota archaeon]
MSTDNELQTGMLVIDSETAREALDAALRGEKDTVLSLDLGVTESRVSLDNLPWDVESLRKMADDPGNIFFWDGSGTFKAAIRGDHFYKLIPTGKGKAPALLIDGVLMHPMKDTDPLTDAALKAEACVRAGLVVLEICTGLGYSTIACLDRGVKSIVTIERQQEVLNLARINPWSERLFSNPRVSIVKGDAVEVVKELPKETFDTVLHDPPRFTADSELYSIEFYSQLRRVLRPGGTLFHYVGSPGSRYRGRDMQKGVMVRLREVGFTNTQRVSSVKGVLATRL